MCQKKNPGRIVVPSNGTRMESYMEEQEKKPREFWFTLFRKGEERPLWHSELEIVFLLKGIGKIYFTDTKRTYAVREEDIFVINRFEIQNFELEEDAIALSLFISLQFAADVSPEFLQYPVNCRSYFHLDGKQERFDRLRREFADAFQEQYKSRNVSACLKSKVFAILEELRRYFLQKDQMLDRRSRFESIRSAADYVQMHYKENITLENLAQHTYLSKTYISRSFTKYFGVFFTEYVTLLRLTAASRMICGEKTLAEIAYESGFPNANAMIHAFKHHYGITPGEYRKQKMQGAEPETVQQIGGKEEENRDLFVSLLKYADKAEKSEQTPEKTRNITVDTHSRKQRNIPHWRRILNAGYARCVIDGTIQRELSYLQEHVGFEYIRVKGILGDDMCFIRRDMQGETVTNYTYIDEVLDFILSVNAKPMLEFSEMPEVLAQEPLFRSMRPGCFVAPLSIERWGSVIQNLMEHLAERYGIRQLRTWLFAPWFAPDFIEVGLCTPEEYEEIYAASYQAIRAVSENLLIAGPGTIDHEKYLGKFLSMCRRRQCMPDIITFRSFASGKEQEDELKLIGNNESFSTAVSADENLIKHAVKSIRKILKEEGMEQYPLVLEEWSNNVWQRDLCNDTCYKSAYLFKNILENNQSLNAMGYFTVNDRLDEVPPSASTFHGGFGLFTKNDIPKSACRALELLAQMGEKLLAKGDGYFITVRENEIQIFLYNYCHYNLLYRYRHLVNMSQTERYGVFVEKEPQAFFIRLEHMESGRYEVRRYGITKEGGSSFDAWVKMGAPDPMDIEERELLRHMSYPLYERQQVEVSPKEGFLNIKANLEPLDVWMIRITKI